MVALDSTNSTNITGSTSPLSANPVASAKPTTTNRATIANSTQNSSLAPIVLFTYNRPRHTRQTLEALIANPLAKKSELFIYQDAPRDNATQQQKASALEVTSYIQELIATNTASKDNTKAFQNITFIQREQNLGLADSIIDGVTTIVNRYGRVIVLEDDIVVSPVFLEYMNTALALYENEEKVACVSGFVHSLKGAIPSTFFLKGADCWGWATWKRAWRHFNPSGEELLENLQTSGAVVDFDKAYNKTASSRGYTQMLLDQIQGKNSSWAIRWIASCFLQDTYCLYPSKSLVRNIGFDIGTHCNGGESNDPFFGILSYDKIEIDITQPIIENPLIRAQCDAYYERAFERLNLFEILLEQINLTLHKTNRNHFDRRRIFSYLQNQTTTQFFPYNIANSQLLIYHLKPLELCEYDELYYMAYSLYTLINPKVFFSVIIPAYNRAHSIIQCIDSIMSQEFFNDYEIIIIDDASSDHTDMLISQLQNPKITYFKLQNNKGAQFARNMGINLASGKWITFLDSDDLWHKNTLSTYYQTIQANIEVSFIYGTCIVSDEIHKQSSVWDLAPQDVRFLKSPAPMFQGMAVLKEKFLQIGMLDSKVPSYQEWDTSILLAKICKPLYISQPIFTYKLHASDQISKNHLRDINGYYYVISKHKKDIQLENVLWWNMHIFTLLRRCSMFAINPTFAMLQDLQVNSNFIKRAIIALATSKNITRFHNRLAKVFLIFDEYFCKFSK